MKRQPRLVFFKEPADPGSHVTDRVKLPVEHFLNHFSQENPFNPFHEMIGQDLAKRTLRRAAIDALMRWDHMCSKNFLVTGPSSVGKTTLVRLFAKILRLPLVEIAPRSVTNMDEFFRAIRNALSNHHRDDGTKTPIPLVALGSGNHYELPPCIIFIDEAHALHRNLQNELLKAIEAKDRQFGTDKGDVVSTTNVCWFFATTEVGDLFGPLLNRFTEIILNPYTKAQIAEIVHLNFPHWTKEACKVVAHFENRVPRRAIAFAATLDDEMRQRPNADKYNLALEVAEEFQIDPMGLHLRHLQILKLVADKPMSKARLAQHLQISENELVRVVAPPIMMETEDMPSLITVCQQGYAITPAGWNELVKRELKVGNHKAQIME
jgi:Holliday junction resolvasome RuvABC ATP-dependent DNA helicase subunit